MPLSVVQKPDLAFP